MDISFYLKRPKADRETAIFARISYSTYQVKYYLPEKINPVNWDGKTQEPKKGYQPEFKNRLQKIKSAISDCVRAYQNGNGNELPNPETLKRLLDKEIRKVEPVKDKAKTFFSFFQEIIDLTKNGGRVLTKTGKPYSASTIKTYVTTYNRLKAFQATRKRLIDFDTIDIDFYTDLTQYLSKQLNSTANTIGKDIKIIKVILNEAFERGINKNVQYKSKKFSKISEETFSIYLDANDLNEIEALNLEGNSRLDNVRDLFLIGCYTGLRFSDFSLLTPEKMKDGFIEIEQQKTGFAVVIPIHDAVIRILNKNNGQLPRPLSNQKMNEYLKEIGQMAKCLTAPTSKTVTKGGFKVTTNYEKWELLTTHTARRSFSTNEYKEGTPAITIMAITGHKTEKAFLKYIKLTPKEHAILLKTHWDKRRKLRAV